MVEIDRSAFIAKFQEEAGEYLQRLNEGVIRLESEPDDTELIGQMLRDAHTLKGSSRMVGLIEISDVAHKLEDFMVKVRDKQIAYTPEMSGTFFEALDGIVFLCEHAGKDEGLLDVAALIAKVETLASGEASAEPLAQAAGAEAAGPAPRPKRRRGKKAAGSPAKTAEERADDEDDAESSGKRGAAQSVAAGPQRASREETLRTREQHTVRVRAAQLDSLLNLVSEVVISQIKAQRRIVELRTAMGEMADTWQAWVRLKALLSEIASEDDLRRETLIEDVNVLDGLLAEHRRNFAVITKDYSDDTSRSTTVVSDLQEQGMRLRMLPASTIFNTFPRAVHDLSREFKKEVDLIIEGADTELDKKVLEEINDPLVHIIRNSLDHGVETPDVREAAGKPRKGTVLMAARQEGDHIVIEVSDDGAGIDPDKVRATAVRKGYITENEARSMSDRETVYLIFESGFSTSPIITEISGRGVGMDVVRQFIVDKLKGSLDVESEVGKGTRFQLTIPLTLAIIRALLVRVGRSSFAIPSANIEETLRADPSEIIKVEGREVIRRQRRNIPLVRLGDVLSVVHDEQPGRKLPIVVIGFSGHRIGFFVDGFIGEQQIVIKTLGTHLLKVENIAGVTVLGAGEVVVILNVPDIMQRARTLSGMRVREARVEKHAGPKRILICEDSFTTRELERSIFEAAGYEVEVAVDGVTGLAKLREGLKVDAVVTDVQMPNMDGFAMTRAIRGDDELGQTPVVIVTSLERDEEKAEGIDAGADAYITKSVFNQDTLLDTVERLIR